jgi:hypothetical protein
MDRTHARKTVRRTSARKSVPKTVVKRPATPALRGTPCDSRWRAVRMSSLRGATSRCTGLTIDAQQQTQWCWAAVSSCVSQFYDPNSSWTQCAVVDAELGQNTCCTTGNTAACNQPWFLDRALTRVGCLQSMSGGALSFATVRSLMNADTPPCARQGWAGGGGHFMAIVCCFQVGGLLGATGGVGSAGGPAAQQLKISDPWYGDSIVDYATFVSGYQGTGTWTHSYLTQP